MANSFQQKEPITYGDGMDLRYGLQGIENWISNGLDADAIKFTEAFGKFLAKPKQGKPLTTSQIRNIYGEFTRIKQLFDGNNKLSEIIMIKPKLAYAAARASKDPSKSLNPVHKHLMDILSEGINSVMSGNSEKIREYRFLNLANFFEAILAYHKVFGGKTS